MYPRSAWALVVPIAAALIALLPAGASAATRATKLGTFAQPVAALTPPQDPHRLFVVEQGGTIQLLKDGTRTRKPFLDITRAVRAGGEHGLLSLAFAPDYRTSGKFYVYYTAPRPGDSSGSIVTVDEYTAAAGRDVADRLSRRNLLRIDHPTNTNHNGGQLMFGPDGFLYITTGDGGSGNDPPGNAQNLNVLLGKVLRIDPSGGTPYAIPPGNPFAGAGDGRADEIYAYGLRNPFRASFDRSTGDMVIGDVGQDRAEEVDFAPRGTGAGANYGWRCFEGFRRTASACDASMTTGAVKPVLEQDRSTGFCAIIGGVVVRDRALTDLFGRYLYGDNCQPAMRSARLKLPRASGDRAAGLSIGGLSSLGEDSCGHVYATSVSGPVYRLDGDRTPTPCSDGQEASGAPNVRLTSSASQRALRQKGFRINFSCRESCGFSASGEVRISGTKTRYRLGKTTGLAAPGKVDRLLLAPSGTGTTALGRALARGRRATATITVAARDASGRTTKRRVAIRARR